jgi:hypothetical protein
MKKLVLVSMLFASIAQAEYFFLPSINFVSIKNTPENAQAFCSINGFEYAEFSDYTYANEHEEMVDSINPDQSANVSHCILKADNCEIIQSISCK